MIKVLVIVGFLLGFFLTGTTIVLADENLSNESYHQKGKENTEGESLQRDDEHQCI